MTVNLISYTQPYEGAIDKDVIKDLQELVAYCARVSNPGNQHNTETSEKLIKYMMEHAH